MTEPEYAVMAELVDEIEARNDRLREQADRAEIPAIERNAARLDAVVAVLRMNLPPELFED